jgi:hypothetical protein
MPFAWISIGEGGVLQIFGVEWWHCSAMMRFGREICDKTRIQGGLVGKNGSKRLFLEKGVIITKGK